MVFMKNSRQGGKPNQKGQKKQFKKEDDVDMFGNDSGDDDMDSDGSDDAVVVKTPKGKLSLNSKRVSFQVPSGNTPAKTPVGKKQATPAKNNSASKKQATPGKGSLQKFKGMEQLKSKKGPQQDDEDDDDDDDDEDDSDFDADLDLMGADDDDDDSEGDEDEADDDDDDDEEDDDNEGGEEDDEDDDDDEEDDDDDEEEEVKSPLKGKKQNQKTPQAKQTPAKEKQNVQTPKVAKTPKKEANPDSPAKDNALTNLELERRRQRDSTQLYLGNLPKDTKAQDLKALSSDIISVSLPLRPKKDSAFAFLQFESEEKAEKNFKLLMAKKYKGAVLNVDYVGHKSTHTPKDSSKVQFNPKKLFISGLPLDSTVHEISKYFPKCHTVQLNNSPTYRTATVLFWTEEDGNAAFQQSSEIEVKGVKVSVLHSRVVNKQGKNKRKRNPKNKATDNGHFAKKMKKEI